MCTAFQCRLNRPDLFPGRPIRVIHGNEVTQRGRIVDAISRTEDRFAFSEPRHIPIPLPPGTQTTVPFVIPTTDRSLTISTYNRTSPYIQNWNLEIQREIAHNTTVEVRYLGTKGTKLWGNINLNQVDALHHNRDLYDAFNAVRAGGESALLNQMLSGINLGGTGAQTS